MSPTDMHKSMESNSICSHHSKRVFYFPRITRPIQDDLMARPWPTCWCRRVCSLILAHWLGHMCLPGSTRAACLPLKTEWFQCRRRVPAAGGPEYSWQALSTPGAQALARKASLSRCEQCLATNLQDPRQDSSPTGSRSWHTCTPLDCPGPSERGKRTAMQRARTSSRLWMEWIVISFRDKIGGAEWKRRNPATIRLNEIKQYKHIQVNTTQYKHIQVNTKFIHTNTKQYRSTQTILGWFPPDLKGAEYTFWAPLNFSCAICTLLNICTSPCASGIVSSLSRSRRERPAPQHRPVACASHRISQGQEKQTSHGDSLQESERVLHQDYQESNEPNE